MARRPAGARGRPHPPLCRALPPLWRALPPLRRALPPLCREHRRRGHRRRGRRPGGHRPLLGLARGLVSGLASGLAALAVLAAPAPGVALQEPAPSPAAAAQERPTLPAPPRAFQIPARARILQDSAAQAIRTIERLSTVQNVEAELEEAEGRYEALQALLTAMVETEFVRLERLSRLRDQALLEDVRLEGLRDRISARLTQLGEIHADWMERRQAWRYWQEALREEPGYAGVASDVSAALERIEEVILTASAAGSAPIDLQRRVEELRAEIEHVGAVVTTMRTARRQALLERSQPFLFSGGHRAELVEGGWRAWDPTSGFDASAYTAFLRGHVGFLIFHLLLAVGLALVTRWLRRAEGSAREPGGEERAAARAADTTDAGYGPWKGLLEDPWALGIFVSVVVAMVRITLAPPLWDVLLWALFGATAAVLSQHLFRDRAPRLTVYLLAAFYPAFMLLEVAQLPDAVLRVGLSAVAAFALPVFLVLARRRDAAAAAAARNPRQDAAAVASRDGHGGAPGEAAASAGPEPAAPDPSGGEPQPDEAGDAPPEVRGRSHARRWPLRVGAAIWLLVLLAVVVGFDAMARWLLHATVMSAAVVFVVVLAFAFIEAAAASLAAAAGGSMLRRAAVLLGRRLIVPIRIAVVAVGALVLLDFWGITASPLATWRSITELGFRLGPLAISVDRLLLGAFVVYLAVLLSGLVRSLMAVNIDPTRPGYRIPDGERGLGDSISRLAHYALVTIGVIVALAVLGVELQNFAIVAGALGIGVGFGLQNVVNNFASGLILLFERPVRVGDTVVVGDVWGTIQKIGLRSTVMVTLDQSEMIVPNADLVSEKVINWTLSSPIARIILPVGVAYGSPVARVLEILQEAGLAHRSVLRDPPPEALFIGFGDSSLDFELRIWVENIRLRLQTRSAVLAEVERRLAEDGIEIPFPQRDLHVRSVEKGLLGQLASER